MAFMAGDVKLIDSLKQPLSGYATAAKGSLQDALGRITARSQAGQQASGRPQGEYAGQQFEQASMMGQRGIDDTLGGVLGNASYGEAIAAKKFDRDMALAKRIGALNKPSTLSQVFQGIGGAADAVGQAKGLYDSLGTGGGSSSYGTSGPSYSSKLRLTNPMQGYRGYDF